MAIRFPARSIFKHLFSIVEIKNRREVEKEVYTRYIVNTPQPVSFWHQQVLPKRYITICIQWFVKTMPGRATGPMSLGRMADTVGDNKSSSQFIVSPLPQKHLPHTFGRRGESKGVVYERGKGRDISEFCGGLLQTK